MSIGEIIAVISFACTIIGEIIAMYRIVKKIANGTKCQMRTEMLNMYYDHRDSKEWEEYQRLNFDKLYAAYKSLLGDSFIDDVYSETRHFKVIR